MKKLIISPHADDEILGAFSFIDKDTYVFIISTNETNVNSERPPQKVRDKEVEKLYEYLGVEVGVGGLPVNEYFNYLNDLITLIENEIKIDKPDIILIPSTDTNQDHKAVHNACMIALRPNDKIPFVPTVLEYETPSGYYWGKPFEPNYFKCVDIEKKIKAYEFYESQVRPHRSKGLLVSMAIQRGRQSKWKFAEGFKVVRMCHEETQRNTGK